MTRGGGRSNFSVFLGKMLSVAEEGRAVFQMKGVTQYKRLQVIKVAMEENDCPSLGG